MKTTITNAVIIITLHLAVVACSKMESNDMVFKKSVSSDELALPVPGEQADPTKDSAIVVVEEQPKAPDMVVVKEEEKAPDVIIVKEEEKAPDIIVVKEEEKAPDVIVVKEEEKAPDVIVVKEEEKAPEQIYPESEIPVCKYDLTVRGLGSAAKVVVASAPKDTLLNSVQKGFESLSNADLSAMRNAVELMNSNGSVQVVKESQDFDKQFFKNKSMILVVIHSKPGRVVDLGGLGKDAQIHIMIVSQEHNTVCLRTDGNSSMNELSLTVLTSPKHAARGSILVNGNGAMNSYLKVSGGHRSGSNFEGKSLKDSNFTFITEGKDDTFTSVKGNGVSGSQFDIKIKGLDKTGYGMSANFINSSKLRMEIQGEEDVQAIMNVEKMSGNEVSGWIKAKSGAKADPSISDDIEIMPLP